MQKSLVLFCSLLAVSCSRAGADQSVERRIESLERRLTELERNRPPARQRPQRPTTADVKVDAGDIVLGNPAAKVTVVDAFEFACPYCATVRVPVDELLAKRGNDVRVVYKQLIIHPDIATLPAQAACAAHKQGKFAVFADALWKRAWPTEKKFVSEALADQALEALAGEVGLDLARYRADLGPCRAEVEKDTSELNALGVRSTPTIVINGKIYSGARTLAGLEAAVDAAMK